MENCKEASGAKKRSQKEGYTASQLERRKRVGKWTGKDEGRERKEKKGL